MKNNSSLSSVCLLLLLSACQSAPANAPAVSNPSASPSVSASSNPAPSASAATVSSALPEQLADALRLVQCAHDRTTDNDKKANYKVSLNVMNRYTQDFWTNLRNGDPDGVNNKTFGEARALGCS